MKVHFLSIFIIAASIDIGYSIKYDRANIIRTKRMLGGRNSTIEEHPYQVAVELYGGYLCSGAIISKHYVLTAAHCINFTTSYLKIRSGSSFRENGGTVHDVVDVMVHESYYLNIHSNSNFDIGLARVNPPFSYDGIHEPIALSESSNYKINEKPVISGWGYMEHSGNPADQLQTIEVPLISQKSCNESYRKFDGIYNGQICTGHSGERDGDLCLGDSGAPLILKDKAIGIAIYTNGDCGRLDYPTVYTEVAYYLDWIKKHVEFDLPRD